jgi:hypothetical protein
MLPGSNPKWAIGKKVVDIFTSEVGTIGADPLTGKHEEDYVIYVRFEDGETYGWMNKDEVKRI